MVQNITDNNLNIEQSVDYISNFERHHLNTNSVVGIQLPKSGSVKSHFNQVFLTETSGRSSLMHEKTKNVKKVGKNKGMKVD